MKLISLNSYWPVPLYWSKKVIALLGFVWPISVLLKLSNETIRPHTYWLPRIDNFTDILGEAEVFTALDALWEYLKVPVKDGEKDKIAFTFNPGT